MSAGPGSPRHEREVEAARVRARRADPFAEGAAAARVRKLRSVAIAAGLVFLVLLLFFVSIVRLGLNAHPPALAPKATPSVVPATPGPSKPAP